MKTSGLLTVILASVLALTFVSQATAGEGPGVPDTLPVCTSGLLTVDEEADILYLREEEKLARDVYIAMYNLWQDDVFNAIAQSEQRHMDAVAGLIECYELTDSVADDTPGVFTDTSLAQLYDTLIESGSVSIIEAFRVGMLIEEKDIADLRDALALTDKVNIVRVYTNLESASCSHLRAFYRRLVAAGESYDPQILTPEEFDAIIDAGLVKPKWRWKGNKVPALTQVQSQVGLSDSNRP